VRAHERSLRCYGNCTTVLHADICLCAAQAEPEATADPADILHRAMAADAATIAAGCGGTFAAGPQLGAAGPFAAGSPVGDINAAVIRAQMRLETQAAAAGGKVLWPQHYF
jgi:hypothetical protein